MNRRAVLIGAIGAVVVLVLWWFALWSPRASDIEAAEERRDLALDEVQQLELRLARLEALAEREPQLRRQVEDLRAAVPDTPDLGEFIIDANEAADLSGIDFLTITPAPPEPGGDIEDPAEIRVALTVDGGYFQVLDFLNRMAELPRLVVIDTLTVSSADEDGVVRLSASISGRLFLTAVPSEPIEGEPTPPPAEGATTTTTEPEEEA